MPPQQLSFWDNEALETGYRRLADLKLEEAESHFNKALEAGIGELDSVKKLIEACGYWLARIRYLPESGDTISSSEQIDALLTAFVHYPFTPQMNAFKKALLTYIVSLLHDEVAMDLKSMEAAFDLLLESGDLQNAENLVLQSINQHPENSLLLYLLAQVQWLSGNRSEASRNYTWLLLHHPDKVEFNRIENNKLKALIYSHGAAMAPAYGWLQNVVPLISPSDEIDIYNDEHRKAIECYRLLIEANKALLNNQRDLYVRSRKQLKTLSPEFFAAYFKWLQSNSK
jgi:tetratricopeptide (TPR) repeat protein